MNADSLIIQLHFQAVLCNCPDAVTYLAERCKAHDSKDITGFTPLDYAKQLERNEMIIMLEKHKSTQTYTLEST